MPEGPGTILGCLPVTAAVWFSRGDGYTTDDDAGVDQIFWRKRDGSKGKEIPQHVRDRAEAYDYAFCDLIEQVSEHLVHEDWLREHPEEATFQLTTEEKTK
jgi:hypothetical protein